MELNQESLIRKILVKCPPLLEDAFNTFPFLIALSEEFPRAEINLICEEGGSFSYLFLPYKVRCFERPREKLSLIQTHHFCVNLNDVFNIDLFFDLENSLNSSFLGYNFCSKERVGYGIGWNKYFLTQNFLLVGTPSLETRCLQLLSLYTKKSFSDLKISSGRDEATEVENIEQLFKEPVPPKFILIMLDNFQNVTKEISRWTKFFDSFHDQKFVIWSYVDQENISELFSKIDLGHNQLYMHRGYNPKELLYLFNRVMGVVTNNLWAEGLVTYFGVNSLSFLSSTQTTLPSYQFFKCRPPRFFFSESGGIQYKYLEEEKDFLEMNLVVDHLHFQFKL
jgi:hypothetical protein